MSRILLFLMVGGFWGGVCFGQTTIAQWNFNSGTADGNVNTGTKTPNISVNASTDSIISVGGIATSFISGSGSDPDNAAGDNSGLRTVTYPSQGTNNKSAGIEIPFNSIGYKDLTLSFEQLNSGTAANTITVQYLSGGVWTDIISFFSNNSTSFQSRTNINLPASLNNFTDARLRIVAAFNGSGSLYAPTTSASYATTGTIRYDLVTIKGTPLSCGSYPTTQARYLYMVSSAQNSMRLGLNRGNGSGCIVVCKQAGLVDANPADGTSYTAAQIFGTGQQIGTGNYVVYKSTTPGYKEFSVTGLTPGVAYYFAVYEYSSSGNCYMSPPLTGVFYAGATLLYPGDMLITAYDNSVGGVDRYCITTLKDLNKGTTFQLVNSRFEAAQVANKRNFKWYGQSNDIYQNPGIANFVYTGNTPLAAGSVIKFDIDNSIDSVSINGVNASSLFTTSSSDLFGGMLSGTAGDQVYLVQGNFTPFGTPGVDRYNMLAGSVLHGISNGRNWVGFTSSPSGGGFPYSRESRLPPQITCLNMAFPTIADGDASPTAPAFVYYNGTKSGTRTQLLAAFTTAGNWTSSLSGSSADNLPASVNNTYSVSSSTPNGQWNGSQGNDWFNCKNWEGMNIPFQLTDVIINPGVMNLPVINSTTSNAPLYDTIATCRNLSVNDGASLSIGGSLFPATNAKERLVTWGKINLSSGSAIGFSSNLNALYDTLYIESEINSLGNTSFIPGLGAVVYSFNIDTVKYLTGTAANRIQFNALGIVNHLGVKVGANPKVDVNGVLGLVNGVIDNTTGGEFVIKSNCSVVGLVPNDYNETDNGSTISFINGKASRETAASGTLYKFPIGKIVNGIPVYAPCGVTPASGTLKTYTAEYFAKAHFDIFNVMSPINHVSLLEYWDIKPDSTSNAGAKVKLSWRPSSNVGTVQQIDSMIVAHYFDPGMGDIWSSEDNVLNPSKFIKNIMGNYGTIETDFLASAFKPSFTLATRSNEVILPIQLLSFQAIPQTKTVKLQWQVLDETDAAAYTIEKSRDGRNFAFLQKLPAKHYAGIADYLSYDIKPTDGWNYYRLIITNKQGKTFTYKTEKVWMGSSKQLMAYPNPATTTITMVMPETNATIVLIDASGKMVKHITTGSHRNMTLDVSQIPRGMYLLRYRSSARSHNQKIILQ